MGLWHAFFLTATLAVPEPPDSQLIPALINALRDKDLEVRAYTGAALAELGAASDW